MVCRTGRRVVVISGAPGAGKTTLARPLAERLGFALLSKDDIKETLFTAMEGEPGDAAFSRRIGAAAMEVLWALAPHCPAVVLEANFRTSSAYERGRVEALMKAGAQIIEIHCRIALEEAARRFAARAREQRSHPAHVLQEMSVERLREYAEPFGLGPVLEVDTGQPVGLDVLLARVEALWRSAP